MRQIERTSRSSGMLQSVAAGLSCFCSPPIFPGLVAASVPLCTSSALLLLFFCSFSDCMLPLFSVLPCASTNARRLFQSSGVWQDGVFRSFGGIVFSSISRLNPRVACSRCRSSASEVSRLHDQGCEYQNRVARRVRKDSGGIEIAGCARRIAGCKIDSQVRN